MHLFQLLSILKLVHKEIGYAYHSNPTNIRYEAKQELIEWINKLLEGECSYKDWLLKTSSKFRSFNFNFNKENEYSGRRPKTIHPVLVKSRKQWMEWMIEVHELKLKELSNKLES